MAIEPNLTTLRIFKVLLQSTARQHSGYSLAKNLGINLYTGYDHLRRLETAGVLESEWESVNADMLNRPRRRFYTLTVDGQKLATSKLRLVQVSSI